MEPDSRALVLIVDDDPAVVEGLSHHIRRRYDVVTAADAAAALDLLAAHVGVAVILSDARIAGTDGAIFLREARHAAPDAARILLTAEMNFDDAVAAINEGQVFRILTRPCPSAALMAAVDAGAAQHRLVTAERVLLQQTLHGSIKTLTDVLALTDPVSFGRATRVKRLVSELAVRLGIAERWQVEVAAMLSQIACMTLPEDTVEKVYYGHELTESEQHMVARLPAVTDQLLANIPRLDEVREILANCNRKYRPTESAANDDERRALGRGAQLLRVAIDYDVLEAQGASSGVAIDTLRGRTGLYDPQIIEALVVVRGRYTQRHEVRELPLRALSAGMIFTQDVKLANGTLLVGRGGEVTAGFLQRVRNFRPGSIKEPIRVRLRVA
jgi:CheY-like chemotaxis protein